MKNFIFLVFAFAWIEMLQAQEIKNESLVTYLKTDWLSPEDYVISKFKDHDYVFIGEYHRIRHDVMLISNLIPLRILCMG